MLITRPRNFSYQLEIENQLIIPTTPQVTIGIIRQNKVLSRWRYLYWNASSSIGDVVVYVRFNEQIDVTGTPQLQLETNQLTLGSNFGTIMDYNSGYSDLSNGIIH